MENYMQVFGRFKKATNPMLMVAAHDGMFYYVDIKSRDVLWEYDSKEPMLSRCIEKFDVEGGVVSTPKITGVKEEEIKEQCKDIFGEDLVVTNFQRVYHIHTQTGVSHKQDGDDLLLIHRTIWHIIAKGSLFQYSVLDVFFPVLKRDTSLSKRLKCPVFHARSPDQLIDICKRLEIHLPGNGSLVRLINMSRKIELAEKIPNTSFFQGSFQRHAVVVKKVSRKEYDDYYSKTAEIYETCYDLDGVVRLEFSECDGEYHYIAFERCLGNLVDVFKDRHELITHDQRVTIMRDLILAVNELNGKHIMHGNLNPRNVLIQSSSRGYRVKLCGLKNSKKIDHGFSLDEICSMHHSERSNLGETLLYIMSNGEYKFHVEGADDDGWTLAGKKDIINDFLGKLPLEFSPPIILLMGKDDRYVPLEALLVMPCFWGAKKKMYFLRDVGDQLLDIDSGALESRNLIFGGNWEDMIDKNWFESMKKSKDGITHHYDTTKMKDLIILCRYSFKYPGNIFPGNDPITLEGYLFKTWPLMFMHVYTYAQVNCPKESAMYEEYFAYN